MSSKLYKETLKGGNMKNLHKRILIAATMVGIFAALPAVSAETPINSCTVINSPGVYVLTQHITDTGAVKCIEITSSDVVLDGVAGYSIDHNREWWGSGHGYGVYIHNSTSILSNVTLKNLNIARWGNGIYLNNVENNSLIDLRVAMNTLAITLDSSQNSTVSNITFDSNYYYSLYLSNSHNNIINRNSITQNNFYYDGIFLDASNNNEIIYNDISFFRRYGLRLSYSSDNRIHHNNFIDNANQATVSGGSNNIFNLVYPYGGNYWSDFDTPAEGCNNTNGDNFCDTSYNFMGGKDNLPLANQVLDDITFPITTVDIFGTPGNNGWYISDVQVNMIATDNDGGSGVQKTEYSFDGTNWNQYIGQFTITNEGTTAVYYRSTDNAGNVESTKTQTIKIDKTPPTITNGATVEEAHLLIGGNIGNVYLAETPSEYAYLIGSGDEWGEIYVTFNYEDSTSETLSVSIPWDWSSPPGDWTGTYAYRKYVGINPVRCSRCTMFEAGFINPNPAKKVMSIKVSDDWVSWYPWSDVFALTLKSADVLTLPDWYSDGSGYYFLEKDDTKYFSTGAGANIFPEYSIYNGIKFYTHGKNDLPVYGGMDLSFDKAVKIDIEPATYNFLGILPPIKTDGSSIFKSGSTVPVKFRIADANGNYVSTAVASITYQLVTDGVLGNVEVPVSTSAANEGNTFRYDSTDNLYIFNLGTEGMNTGTYQLNINLDDGTTHTVRISLR